MQRTWYIVVAAVLLGVGTGLVPAQGAWRCMDQPGESECQEALLNDIEDLMVREWPANPLVLPMPPLPYTCVRAGGGSHQAASDPFKATTDGTRSLAWSIVWTGDLDLFRIGRVDAAARLAGTVEVSGARITAPSWSDTTIHYVFEEGAMEVLAPSGPTGVSDLGSVSRSTRSGELWTATLHIVLTPFGDGTWVCWVGPAGQTVGGEATNSAIEIDYPLAWTGVPDVLAEGVRAQFRRSVRLAVTGTP